MARFEVNGRSFLWSGGNRLNYVRKAFPRRWVETDSATATHVIHVWLPEVASPWEATARKVR